MTDVTVCALCKNQLRFAKLLPCLDSFCLKCLEDLAVDSLPGGELSCPRCGETFRIPDDGMSALPASPFQCVYNLLKVEKGGADEKDLRCDVCALKAGELSPVTSYCLDCHQSMCQQCSGYHAKFATTKGHEVVPQAPEDRTSVRLEATRCCDKHKNRRLELYCKDCGLVICLKCYTEKHNSHTCSEIGAITDELCEQMRHTVEEMEQLAVNIELEERDLHRARDNILDQVTEVEFTVLRRREELVSCVERDTNELMNDLQYVRDFVSSEFEDSSKKIGKRSAKIDSFKQFTRELLNEGSSSAVADVAGILNQRASEIRMQSQKSGVGKRPSVEVAFQPLGLSQLSQAKNKRKINLVGRITATIRPSEVRQPRSRSMPVTRLPTETIPKDRYPMFEFRATSSSSSRESFSKNRILGHLHSPRIKYSWNSSTVGGCKPPSHVYHFTGQNQQSNTDSSTYSSLPKHPGLHNPRTKVSLNSGAVRGCKPPSRVYQFTGQTQPSKAASSTSSSSDEGSLCNSDQDAVSQPGVVMEDSALLDTVEDSGSAASVVIFSHEAKLSRFVSGSWSTRGVGNLELLRLVDKNVVYLIVKNEQTQKVYLKQSITCDMSMEPVPESNGREFTWIPNAFSDTGHYDMFLVRFKSKMVAANFRLAFVCARELLMLGIRCKTVAATISDAVSTTAAADSVKNEEQSSLTTLVKQGYPP